MSTPTAAGLTARRAGLALATLAPLPWCTCGMDATHQWMNGSAAPLASCGRIGHDEVAEKVGGLGCAWSAGGEAGAGPAGEPLATGGARDG